MNGAKLILVLCVVLILALAFRLSHGPAAWPPRLHSARAGTRAGDRPAPLLATAAPESLTVRSAAAGVLGADSSSSPGTALQPLAHRLRRERQRAQRDKWVSLTPVSAAGSVSLLEDAKLVSYYTVRPARPVRVRVVGPTSVEVRARLDFDPTMRGAQVCDLRLSDAGRPVGNAAFTTTKALAASYTNLRDRVPSKVRHFVYRLGGGVHVLEVSLVRPAHGTAEVRVSIPKTALQAAG